MLRLILTIALFIKEILNILSIGGGLKRAVKISLECFPR